MNFRTAALLCFTTLLVTILTSCDPGAIGSAVVLWPEEGWAVSPGAVVSVLEESEVQQSYRIRIPAADQTRMSPKWRLRYFETEEAARAYAADLEPYAEQFGSIVGRPDGLGAQRVYTAPNARSELTVYRLRSGERFKILDRSEEPANEAGAVAHWYKILTRDGTIGWVFGYYLQVDGSPVVTQEDEQATNAALERALATVWRPSYFRDMINSGHYDLDQFQPQYGLFPQPAENTISLNLPERQTEFNYTDVIRGSRGRYVFEGSSLQMTIRNDSRISIQYEYRNEIYSQALYLISEDIQSLREEEQRRRDQAYQEIRSRGDTLLSTAYGTIRLQDNRQFQWEGYGRLVPSIIPEEAGNSGDVLFSYYLADEIADNFEGALAFQFLGRPSDEPIVFLYRFREGGIRLSRVTERDIDDNVVTEESISPLIMFFNFR
jgi:hypothetical protein